MEARYTPSPYGYEFIFLCRNDPGELLPNQCKLALTEAIDLAVRPLMKTLICILSTVLLFLTIDAVAETMNCTSEVNGRIVYTDCRKQKPVQPLYKPFIADAVRSYYEAKDQKKRQQQVELRHWLAGQMAKKAMQGDREALINLYGMDPVKAAAIERLYFAE